MELSSAGPGVLDALRRACSQDASVLHSAEEQLKTWETQPGFYTVLVMLFSDHNIEPNVRWLAVLYFKNGIERYWRRNAINGISEDEKGAIRLKLVSQFTEPVMQIATQQAVLIAKIARLDCPRQWPELLPTLLQAVRCEETLTQQRALLVLHHVIKALASKRLASDRIAFEELTSNVLTFILGLWDKHTNQCFVALHSHEISSTVIYMDQASLALKVLRKLTVFGLKQLKDCDVAVQFVTLVFQRIEQFIKTKDVMVALSRELQVKREKMLILLTKVLLEIQEHHTESFLEFIRPSLQLCLTYNFSQVNKELLFERLAVNIFNLMRFILRCELYRGSRSVSVSEEGGDSWKFSLRPCIENLYLTIVKEFREICTVIIVELLKQQQLVETDPNNLSDLLKKDAVYNAVGQASFDLFDDIDFDRWFQSRLIPELNNKHTNYRVLRRRVIWLIGCWVGVKFSPIDSLTRLSPVDDFEFKTEHFLPYLERSFGLLFQLLKDVQECETKMQVLHVMSFIIERMQTEIRPYAGALIQYLPMLWEESADHNMLRCAILCTLTSLVQGLGPVCTTMFDFLLPVIKLSTDVSNDPHVYLYEDGLDLWYNTIICTPTLTPQLLELYTNMSPLLELGSETLKTCLEITEAYVLLAPAEFIQKYSEVLVKDLASLRTDLKTEGLVLVYSVIELIFCVVPKEGPTMFMSMLPSIVKTFVDSQVSVIKKQYSYQNVINIYIYIYLI
ncbi:hypothetical protein LSH36_425g01002 [Paralvinella palmiformis]|uniref:Importin N-terminal domain-containing protein n=1 Tax=Paralvinella palmiformis TaxID=53620 RepID=A0AAD9JBG9_9ANNE|nr:hypothetical protein LSH36_425g01002 [Paralvinella palmiformis]